MASTARMKAIGLGLLTAGVFVGATGAEAVRALINPRNVDTGVFSVRAGEEGRFFVALHDARNAAPANVLLQILDADGKVVVQGNAALAAGHSTSLAVEEPGTYRGHAHIRDVSGIFGPQRAVVGSAEVGNALTLVTRPVCPIAAIDESHTSTRP